MCKYQRLCLILIRAKVCGFSKAQKLSMNYYWKHLVFNNFMWYFMSQVLNDARDMRQLNPKSVFIRDTSGSLITIAAAVIPYLIYVELFCFGNWIVGFPLSPSLQQNSIHYCNRMVKLTVRVPRLSTLPSALCLPWLVSTWSSTTVVLNLLNAATL